MHSTDTSEIEHKSLAMKGAVSAQLRLRFMHDGNIALGPGKISLLEALDKAGSINKAAKEMGMSYKRAWDLVNAMNLHFCEALVITSKGGEHGGGAQLSTLGREVMQAYRAIEQEMLSHQQTQLEALAKFISGKHSG